MGNVPILCCRNKFCCCYCVKVLVLKLGYPTLKIDHQHQVWCPSVPTLDSRNWILFARRRHTSIQETNATGRNRGEKRRQASWSLFSWAKALPLPFGRIPFEDQPNKQFLIQSFSKKAKAVRICRGRGIACSWRVDAATNLE